MDSVQMGLGVGGSGCLLFVGYVFELMANDLLLRKDMGND